MVPIALTHTTLQDISDKHVGTKSTLQAKPENL